MTIISKIKEKHLEKPKTKDNVSFEHAAQVIPELSV